jgi:radical SAM superfamily enzyme YgiQ (UPF0313 family)
MEKEQTTHRRRFRIIIPAYPAFNIYSRIARMTTALGPICVGTVINKTERWDVEIIDENNYGRFGPKDTGGKPDHEVLQRVRRADVVGFYGGLTSTVPRLYELADFYKKQGVITIAGGQHFVGENIREALDSAVDFVVIGEGEQSTKELLDTIDRGLYPDDVAGIAFLRKGQMVQTSVRQPLTDFDKLPLPEFSLLRYAKIKIYPVGWVRGCGMNCEFCTVKGKVRCPAPEYVINQISALIERQNARHFFLVDDLFGQNRKATLRLCQLLREYQAAVGVRIDITVQIRLDKAKDGELLEAMRGAGITTVAIGFESPIPEELAAMNKKLKPEDMLAMTRLFHKAGFLVHGMFIFGYPIPEQYSFNMPAKERVRCFRKFIRKARIDTVQTLLPVPLPGTEMTQRLARQNRIFSIDCVGWEYYDGNFPLFEPDKPLTPEELQRSTRKIMGRFYRFRYMFLIALNILIFPTMMFSLYNVKIGWRRWYRSWRNNILRFTGWVILRKWTSEFKKGTFSDKLNKAKKRLHPNGGEPGYNSST